jgi:hypothetical protein
MKYSIDVITTKVIIRKELIINVSAVMLILNINRSIMESTTNEQTKHFPRMRTRDVLDYHEWTLLKANEARQLYETLSGDKDFKLATIPYRGDVTKLYARYPQPDSTEHYRALILSLRSLIKRFKPSASLQGITVASKLFIDFYLDELEQGSLLY